MGCRRSRCARLSSQTNLLSPLCSSHRERRLKQEVPLHLLPGQHRRRSTFRKIGCGPKRAYLPRTALFSARPHTTNLGPFGEVIRATSAVTRAIPIRWSTKYTDLETDLVYYGYRYYNPSTGRWLSRDPKGEKGGLNLYGFVSNRPLTDFDPQGLGTWTFHLERGDKILQPGPFVTVLYKADKGQTMCCTDYIIKRYARPHVIGAMIPEPWRFDESGLGGTVGNPVTGSPASAEPDEPSQRLWLLGWLVPLVADFRYDVICTGGANKNKVLTSIVETLVVLGNGGEWVGYPAQPTVIIND